MNDRVAIERIPLYTHLDRISSGLAALGIGAADPIRPDQLFPLDQWHYHGTEAIRAAADRLGLGPASRVLEIGSGIGGPARYLAHTTGCHVTALELQPKVHAVAAESDATLRSGRARPASVRRRIAASDLEDAAFDAVEAGSRSCTFPIAGACMRAWRPGAASRRLVLHRGSIHARAVRRPGPAGFA